MNGIQIGYEVGLKEIWWDEQKDTDSREYKGPKGIIYVIQKDFLIGRREDYVT